MRSSATPVATRRAVAAIAVCGVVGVLLRLRFMKVPLNTDEAGYSEIARLWSRGEHLYGPTAWVDRPQGLMLAIRAANAISTQYGLRIVAIIGATVALAALAAAVWALAGPRAAIAAAALYAVLSPAPHIEGFTGNGELLGTAVSCCAVASIAWWWRTRRSWLLAAAGFAGAIAFLMKQSAVDGLIVTAVVVIASCFQGRRLAWRDLLGRAGLVLAGAAVPWGAALIHGAATGFHDWWFAIIGHRSQTDSVIRGHARMRWELFVDSLWPMFRDLATLWVLVPFGIWAARRARVLTIPLAWLIAALVGFAVGGLYHPHYWVQLVAPLCMLGGFAIDAFATRSRAVALTALGAALVIPLSYAAPLYMVKGPNEVSILTSGDPRSERAPRIAERIDEITSPGDRIGVVWADAPLYWHADRAPAFTYIWWGPLQQIKGGVEQAIGELSGPNPPKVVVMENGGRLPETDARVREILRERYRHVEDFEYVALYELR
jgi:4-amino-4-deoxy-L-arabinose transferase-like glycosyltransferase